MSRFVLILIETAGLALAAMAGLAVNAFLSADTPAEAVTRGLARLPEQCEEGYLNHGAYSCWYTISAQPFLFALSAAAIVSGGTISIWAQRRWPRARTKREASQETP